MADSPCGTGNPAGATQGRGAVKDAISLPRAVFGMPVKEQIPKLVDRAIKGEL